jgi:diaminopimelate epimerase
MNFIKAQGLGNDFVMLIDPEIPDDSLGTLSQCLSDRRYGVGCDQVIVAFQKNGEFFARFFNPDGSEAESCGNGSRCIAKYLMQQNQRKDIKIKTLGGMLDCNLSDDGMVTIAMPSPTIEILVLGGVSTLGHLSTPDAVAVNVGNPHLVCFVNDINIASQYGEGLENHPMFPMRTNVNFVKLINDEHIELKVWERGAGITPACGSGACASMVAAFTHKLVKSKVKVTQQGGDLWITYDGNNLLMTGPAEIVFKGDYKE